MSAAFVDYDNDGHLDIYTGNMWTAAGQRVTAQPGFKPDAPPEIREIYRRHARGNSLFRNRGDGTFEDVTLAAGAEFGRWAWSSDAFDFDSDGWDGPLRRERDVHARSRRAIRRRGQLLLAPGGRAVAADPQAGHGLRRRLARHQPAPREQRRPGPARAQRAAAQRRPGRFDEVSATAGLDLDQDGRVLRRLRLRPATATPTSCCSRRGPRRSSASSATTSPPATPARLAPDGHQEQPRRDRGARTIETDTARVTRIVQAGLRVHLAALEGASLRARARARDSPKRRSCGRAAAVQTLADLPLNQRVWIEEGGRSCAASPSRRRACRRGRLPAFDGAASGHPSATAFGNVAVPALSRARLRAARPRRAGPFALGLAGQPVVVSFWATWAPPSQAALQDVSHERRPSRRPGAHVLAVAVDPRRGRGEGARPPRRGVALPVMLVAAKRWPAPIPFSTATSSTAARTCGCRRCSS